MAYNVKVNYQGDMYCNISYITGDYNIITSAAHSDYFSPVELLAASLSACTVSMIAATIEGKALPVKAEGISMETETLVENHKVLGFNAVIKIAASENLSDKDKNMIEAAAKSCPVKGALSSDLEITYEFRYE